MCNCGFYGGHRILLLRTKCWPADFSLQDNLGDDVVESKAGHRLIARCPRARLEPNLNLRMRLTRHGSSP